MTEAEWLACDDSNRLVCQMRSGSDRKLRLIACALCRTLWIRLSPLAQESVELAEKYADGLVEEKDRDSLFWRLRLAGGHDARRVGKYLPACAVSECGWYAAELGLGSGELSTTEEASIIRDIFGNPFHPVIFSPSWRTDTAVALARQMYRSRDFGAMPILADALQDAGCDSEEILTHCRDPKQVHVRGCWVVDMVLGRG